jgi:glycosyltransferase involved in cell wall biosynthesis
MQKDITILFSGRLQKRKGLAKLKELADYIETVPGYTLNIACNDKTNADLFQNNAKTTIQTGLGLEQMRAFYNSGDALFFPSLYEGFSMATLEALACGIPVIGTGAAIQEELRKYDFVMTLNDDMDMPCVFKHIDRLVEQYGTQKTMIHEQIKHDFGYDQYEKKLLSLI